MDFKKIAREIRKDIIRMHAASNMSHIGSSLSSADILVALYFGIMRINIKKPCDRNNDRFILSKGHGASALYAILSQRGFFNKTILKKYCCDGSLIAGHSTRNCLPGIEVSAGSLGHGLSIGAGMALAAKIDNLKYRLFVLLSDGECDEGSVWEAALFAGHHKLDNLIAIIDYNKLQAFGRTGEVLDLEPFADKWKSFGWETREIDGHNIEEAIKTLKEAPFQKYKPGVVIAHTIKGKGVSFMENSLLWHYKTPNKKELKAAMAELR